MTRKDIIQRLYFYLDKLGWSKYRLTEESGLSRSTIEGVFDETRKGVPGIPTLRPICHAMGISLSEFFEFDSDDEAVYLNQGESAWVDLYRFSPKGRLRAFLSYAKTYRQIENIRDDDFDRKLDIIEESLKG